MDTNLILTLIGLAITVIGGIGALIFSLFSKISELRDRLETLTRENRLQEMDKIQSESVQKLPLNQLAADMALQQAQVAADMALQQAQVKANTQTLTQQVTTLAKVVNKLQQEKVSTRLKSLEVQVEKLKDARWFWWYQLDKQWQAIFKEAIGIKSEPTENELVTILHLTKLNCFGKELTNLEPLRALTDLQTLDCRTNKLTNLEPLRALTGLQTLNCSSNQLTSLEPLRALAGLQTLNSFSNQLTSLEPLRTLTGLQALFCNDNHLTSLEPLYGMNRLRKLYCKATPSLSQAEIERFKKAVPSCYVG
jgi:Leucine-rich repeat (LRR) protein